MGGLHGPGSSAGAPWAGSAWGWLELPVMPGLSGDTGNIPLFSPALFSGSAGAILSRPLFTHL